MIIDKFLLTLSFAALAAHASPAVRVQRTNTATTGTYTETATSYEYTTYTTVVTSTAVNPACPNATIPTGTPRIAPRATHTPTPVRIWPTTTVYVSTVLETVTETSTTVTTPACPSFTDGPTEPPVEPRVCGEGKVEEVLIFDDIVDIPAEPYVSLDAPYTYKGFLFDELWGFTNCNVAGPYADQTCIPDTFEGDNFLSLTGTGNTTRPAWRRIIYDYENDDSSFDLLGFYISVPPSRNMTDYRSVIYCGWNVANQDNEASPTWCKTKYFNSADNALQEVTLTGTDTEDLAFIEIVAVSGQHELVEFGNVLENARAKGATPVDVFLDDIRVCVPAPE